MLKMAEKKIQKLSEHNIFFFLIFQADIHLSSKIKGNKLLIFLIFMLIQSGLSSIGLSFSDYFPKTIKFPGFFISHISVNTYFPPPVHMYLIGMGC